MNDPRFRQRSGIGCLLDEAVKDESTTASSASIETKGELLEIGLEVRVSDRALVGSQDLSLEKARHPMNARHGYVRQLSGRRDNRLLVPISTCL